MNSRVKSIVISVFFIIFGGFLYFQSLGIRTLMSNDVGSSFFPKFVAVSIIVVAIAKIIFALKETDAEVTKKTNADMAGGWITIALLGLYVLVFSRLGFIVSTVIYLFLQILVLKPAGKTNYPLIGAVSVITPFLIYGLFVYVISMPLPKGIFGF